MGGDGPLHMHDVYLATLLLFSFFDGLELFLPFFFRSSRSDRSASFTHTRSLLFHMPCHATFCVLLFSLLFGGLNGPDGLLSFFLFFSFCELSLRTRLLDSVFVSGFWFTVYGFCLCLCLCLTFVSLPRLVSLVVTYRVS